jgi:dTDP-N-acetylfucosamine:lipid II N-acetylfucosaminyltransferase
MIHHLFPGWIEHHVPVLIQFFIEINEQLPTPIEQHVFVFYDASPKQLATYSARLPENCRMLSIRKGKLGIFTYLWRFKTGDSLILHSAFYPWVWISLLCFPRLWKKTSWVMWGADIYGRKSWKGSIYRRLKAIVVRRLGAVSALVPGDFRDLEALIGPCNNYVRAIYAPRYNKVSRPNSEGQLQDADRNIHLVLGNSAWEQNDHLPVLHWLHRFMDQKLQVVCPLGYPKTSAYKSRVIATGREILGEKFKPLEAMLPWDAYHELLGSSDILVLNSLNQQGLGNIYYMLLNGGKVYVRGDCSTYQMLKEFDFHVYDTRALEEISYDELIAYSPELAEHNRKQFQKYLSTEATIKDWSIFLGRIGALPSAA